MKNMATQPLEIIDAHVSRLLEEIRILFEEYRASVDADLCFQQFTEELATLPGAYVPPRGCLLMARVEGRPAGCVALRKLEEDVAEMKRLYVVPACRGTKLGRALVDTVIRRAPGMGYRAIRLDTLPSMARAIAMYESIGFSDIEAYYPNPMDGARYMELSLI
jgi:ribosomal protein S18 acetylase RimI-like enzyme